MLDDVAIIRNCIIPTHLYYVVDRHTWLRRDEDEVVTLGLTDVAQTTAGAILHVTFKKVGAVYPRGKDVLSVPTVFVGSTRFVGVPRWDEMIEALNSERAGRRET